MISVLYVDDDLALLELVKHYLEHSGDLRIDTAGSVSEAIEKLKRHPYEAIVSDYQMPGLDGIDLLKYIRERDSQIPFLLFTGRGREEVVIEALTNGADFYLQKGNHIESQFIQLEHEIRESVRRRRSEREHKKIASVLRIQEAAVRSALSPIAISDLEGTIIYANPACLAIWGFTDEREVVGRAVTDFVSFPEIARDAISILLQEKTWSGQVVARRQDGSTFDARVFASTTTDESDQPNGFVASFTDLTGEKNALSQLESYIRDIRYVSEKATEMNDFPLEANIWEFIANSLTALAPPGAVVMVNSVGADTTIRVEAIQGADRYLPVIGRALGQPLTGMIVHSSAEGLREMLSGTFVEIDGGIHGLAFGQLPTEICDKLETLPFIGKIIGAGLSWKGKVNGVAIIIIPPGCSIENLEVLDLFVRHSSAVLQRRQAEMALRTANVQLDDFK